MNTTKLSHFFKLLPKFEQIKHLTVEHEQAAYILNRVFINLTNTFTTTTNGAQNAEHLAVDTEECFYLLQSLLDHFWERVNIGAFSDVPMNVRKIYALANYLKIFYLLLESIETNQLELCNQLLDDAKLIGCTNDLFTHCDALHQQLMQFCQVDQTALQLPIMLIPARQQFDCDIPQLSSPSLEYFRVQHFEKLQPALLLNTMQDWPAMNKWRDLNYILALAGNRTVPIEIGKNYTNDDWSQQLIKLRDFLARQFGTTAAEQQSKSIEYLAQHNLFEQIPELKKDIVVPAYCCLGMDTQEQLDFKVWLGPAGTISPMHYDPKHNLLCQVFGQKKIILAAPEETANLYAHETQFLSNTSQIDVENLDLQQFPNAANVKFYKLTLQAGDCLYLPPKWWHYVRAETKSFSVSCWWN